MVQENNDPDQKDAMVTMEILSFSSSDYHSHEVFWRKFTIGDMNNFVIQFYSHQEVCSFQWFSHIKLSMCFLVFLNLDFCTTKWKRRHLSVQSNTGPSGFGGGEVFQLKSHGVEAEPFSQWICFLLNRMFIEKAVGLHIYLRLKELSSG